MLQKDEPDKQILCLFTTADGQVDVFRKQTKTMILGFKPQTSVKFSLIEQVKLILRRSTENYLNIFNKKKVCSWPLTCFAY